MIVITNEAKASRIFHKYRNVAAFSLSKGLKGYADDKVELTYEKLNFLPDEDTINGIKSGDIKLSKVIKQAVKAICSPSNDAIASTIGLGMCQFMTMATSRHRKKGPAVLVFVVNKEEDPERAKIMTKFLKGVLKVYGMAPITKGKVIKKLFSKKSKAVRAVIQFQNDRKNGCTLSRRGAALKKMNQVYYSLELHQAGMAGLEAVDLDSDAAKVCIKTLIQTYSAENLRTINDKKVAKRLAKKDKQAVKAYKVLREILLTIDPNMKLPKVKFGQKKKRGRAVGAAMNSKKFIKFFKKGKNRPLLMVVYGHSLAMLLGFDPGTKEYKAHMLEVCSKFKNDFGKTFVAAAAAFAKETAAASKV